LQDTRHFEFSGCNTRSLGESLMNGMPHATKVGSKV
jgi:hypothetical protein